MGCAFYELEHVVNILQDAESKQYQLNAHHLSFYATLDPAHPCLSEYHYTAYFFDQVNKHCQLHVYFDSKDQIGSIVFSQEKKDGMLATVSLSSVMQDRFALEQSCQTIVTLRHEHQLAREELERCYKKLEQQLTELSGDVVGHRYSYLSVLDEIVDVLGILSGIHSTYLHRAALFNRIKQSLGSEDRLQLTDCNDVEEEVNEEIHYSEECKEERKGPVKKSIKDLVQLLEFLLMHGDVPVNTFTIDNVTPVLYCYNMHSAKTPKLECLSILVRYNASLFVATASGLSVAHHLVENKQHPLFLVLTENVEKTLSGYLFFQMLRNLAEQYLEGLPENHPCQMNVLRSIQQFTSHLQALNGCLVGGNTSAIIKELAKTERAIVQRFPSVVDEVLQNKEIKDKLLELRMLEENYIARLRDCK